MAFCCFWCSLMMNFVFSNDITSFSITWVFFVHFLIVPVLESLYRYHSLHLSCFSLTTDKFKKKRQRKDNFRHKKNHFPLYWYKTSIPFLRLVEMHSHQQHCCNIYSSKTAWKNYGYIIDLLFLPFLHRCPTFIFPIWENHVENTCITASFH
jgi:hypothetical protein